MSFDDVVMNIIVETDNSRIEISDRLSSRLRQNSPYDMEVTSYIGEGM